MIAYQIMAAAHPEHTARLLRWMWRRGQTYLVSVDAMADVDAFRAVLPVQDNVRLLAEYPVTWGGITQILALLRGIESCLRASTAWRWFVNISDSDIPLHPQEAMIERLRAESHAGYRDFVGRSTYALRAPWFEPFKQPIGMASEPVLEGLRPDVRFRIHPQLRRWFGHEEASPIFNTLLRVALHTTDDPAEKTLIVRPLHGFEVQRRRQFYAGFDPVFGKLWTVLSRQTCEWLVSWHRLPEVLSVLGHTFCPDETVVQTSLFNRDFPGFGWLKPDNLRWKQGSPDFVKDDLLPALRTSDALFARKVRFDASEALFAWVGEIARPQLRA